eukprot:Tamp_25227.p2 GENE.Tamp_25227~~Tamp_25227.p2  ORF type:complete len:104 (+),score=2.02 Tamp_25227:296-607(+)
MLCPSVFALAARCAASFMPMRSWHPLIPNHLDIESLKQLRMHHDAIERATRRWRPKLKPVAFACWFQLVEVRNLIRTAQKRGEEKGMLKMHAILDDDGAELIC